MKQKVRKAVFPVGGLGTRFLPATKSMPKEMLPVVDKPLVHYAFEEAHDSGMEQFIFINGRNKNPISDHFDNSYELQSVLSEKNKKQELELTKSWMPEPGNIIFTRQQEPLGLGHAVWCARNMVNNEPFAVLLADDMILGDEPALKQMLDVYYKTGGNVIALSEVPDSDIHKFGIIDPEFQDGAVFKAKGIVEKPKAKDAPSNLSVIGRYILQPKIFEFLERQGKGAGGEIQLTDALSAMLGSVDLYGVLVSGKRYDCGDKIGFLEANIAYALARDDMRDRMKEIIKEFAK